MQPDSFGLNRPAPRHLFSKCDNCNAPALQSQTKNEVHTGCFSGCVRQRHGGEIGLHRATILSGNVHWCRVKYHSLTCKFQRKTVPFCAAVTVDGAEWFGSCTGGLFCKITRYLQNKQQRTMCNNFYPNTKLTILNFYTSAKNTILLENVWMSFACTLECFSTESRFEKLRTFDSFWQNRVNADLNHVWLCSTLHLNGKNFDNYNF